MVGAPKSLILVDSDTPSERTSKSCIFGNNAAAGPHCGKAASRKQIFGDVTD
jgi:hypothetical protein